MDVVDVVDGVVFADIDAVVVDFVDVIVFAVVGVGVVNILMLLFLLMLF